MTDKDKIFIQSLGITNAEGELMMIDQISADCYALFIKKGDYKTLLELILRYNNDR